MWNVAWKSEELENARWLVQHGDEYLLRPLCLKWKQQNLDYQIKSGPVNAGDGRLITQMFSAENCYFFTGIRATLLYMITVATETVVKDAGVGKARSWSTHAGGKIMKHTQTNGARLHT